jgi:hypothetical protein
MHMHRRKVVDRRYAVQAVPHEDVERRLSTPSGLCLLRHPTSEIRWRRGFVPLAFEDTGARFVGRVVSRGFRGLRRKIEYSTARASLRDRLRRGRIVIGLKFPRDGFGDLSHLVGAGLCRVRGVGQE